MPKTQINQKQLYERRNTTDVFSRLVVMGMLRILNKKLSYEQIWNEAENDIQKVTVPFFFDFGGANSTERFIQDNYMHWTDDECTEAGIRKIDGDFKIIPYGVITLESSSIDSGNISNRFVMGKYQKKIGNELKSFVSCLYTIPITMNFQVTITADTVNTMWKIEQAYREFFYKNKTFRINYKGTAVPCRVGFPESLTANKTTSYQMGQNAQDGSNIKITFSLACETYQPVFDQDNEIPAEHIINSFQYNIVEYPNNISCIKDGKKILDKNIEIITKFKNDDIIIADKEYKLEWNSIYSNNDLLQVDILASFNDNDNEYVLIDTVDNHEFYYLTLNSELYSNYNIDIILPNNEDCIIVNNPIIKVFPDFTTNIIKEQNVVVIDKGFILTKKHYIEAVISYEDRDGKIIEHYMQINIINNAVDEEHPVSFENFVYNNDINYKKIKLFIRDHNDNNVIVPFQDDNVYIKIY